MSVILVTGASTGIGQATALHLASKGHQVFAGVRSPDKVDELREKIAAEDLSVEIIQLDITDQDTIIVRKGPHPLSMITLPGRQYFNVLKAKLRWSGGRV